MFPPPVTSPHLRQYRLILGLFIVGLVISGVTAFPLLHELDMLLSARGLQGLTSASPANSLDHWLLVVRDGLQDTYAHYPWIAYGTDWLAFAHLIIALFFIGPMIDPCRNVWVIQAGIVACALVIPLALICGSLREIPLGWRFIDCSFGVFGVIPLLWCLRLTRRILAEDSPSNGIPL